MSTVPINLKTTDLIQEESYLFLARISEFRGKTCVLLDHKELLETSPLSMRPYVETLEREKESLISGLDSFTAKIDAVATEALNSIKEMIFKVRDEACWKLFFAHFTLGIIPTIEAFEAQESNCKMNIARAVEMKGNPFGEGNFQKEAKEMLTSTGERLRITYCTAASKKIDLSESQAQKLEEVRSKWVVLCQEALKKEVIGAGDVAEVRPFYHHLPILRMLEKLDRYLANPYFDPVPVLREIGDFLLTCPASFLARVERDIPSDYTEKDKVAWYRVSIADSAREGDCYPVKARLESEEGSGFIK